VYTRWDSSLDEMIGAPFDISNLDCRSASDLSRGAFELYKETLGLVNVAASVYVGDGEGEYVLARNEAIAVGLLVRLSKFMMVVLQLSAADERGDVVFALNRCVIETATNLMYLLFKNDASVYDQFVLSSFGPERELFETIRKNMSDRGEELPIETRMLASINDACTKADLKIEEVHRRQVDWAGNARTRLRELGREDAYAGLQRVPSHAVHGTWMDLYKRHLKEKDGKFAPDFDWSPVDARLLSPVAIWVLDAVGLYISNWQDKEPALQPIMTRCANLHDRLCTVDEWHEAAMNMNIPS
jgi:hypothetical protein